MTCNDDSNQPAQPKGAGTEFVPLEDQQAAIDRSIELIKKFRRRCREDCKTILSEESSGRKGCDLEPPREVEVPQIISILGWRGSGKTTVLYEILKHLDREFREGGPERAINIVLPTVDVDLLVETEHPLGWIVASFKPVLDHLEKTSKCEEDYYLLHPDSKEMPLRERYRRLWQQVQPYSSLSSDVLRHKEEMSDVSSGFQSLFERKYELRKAFQEFVNALLRALKKEYCFDDAPMIFVSLDDADLHSRMGPRILEGIWTLGFHPCVVYLVCGDPDIFQFGIKTTELARAQIGCIEQFPRIITDLPYKTTEDFFNGFVFEKMNKLLPIGYRSVLKWVPLEERLKFKGKPGREKTEQTLLDLMNMIHLKKDEKGTLKPHTLGDFFDFSWVNIPWVKEEPYPSPYGSCLLTMPRHLCALHDLFASFVERNKEFLDAPEKANDSLVAAYRSELYKLLDNFFHNSIRNAVHVQWEGFLKSIVVWLRERKHVQFDFNSDMYSVVFTEAKIQVGPVTCQRFDRYQIYTEPPSDAPLPRSAVMLLALFHDLMCMPDLLISGEMYRKMIFPVAPLCLRDDDESYWPLPKWNMMLDHFLFEEGWNRLWSELCRKQVADLQEVFFESFFDLVFGILVKRDVPKQLLKKRDESYESLLEQSEMAVKHAPTDKVEEIRKWLGALWACFEDTGQGDDCKRLRTKLSDYAAAMKVTNKEKEEGKTIWWKHKAELELRKSQRRERVEKMAEIPESSLHKLFAERQERERAEELKETSKPDAEIERGE